MDLLRAALDSVQNCYPYLKIRIERKGKELVFSDGGVGKVPIRKAQTSELDWVNAAEEELNTPIDWQQGPLARCVWLQHSENLHHLFFVFSHVIGDGLSGVFVLRDILYAAGAEGGGNEKIFSDTLPMDKRLPKRAKGLRGFYRRFSIVSRFLGEDFILGKFHRFRPEKNEPLGERKARIIPKEFDLHFSQALIDRSRAEETTVHGALSAAMCLAVAHDLANGKKVCLKYRTPVNIRKDLEPPVGEDFGMFVSMLFYRNRIASTDNFWELARRIHKSFSRERRRGFPHSQVPLIPFLYRWINGDTLDDQEFGLRWKEKTFSTCGITNLGQLDFKSNAGILKIESLHSVVNSTVFGEFNAMAASYGGQLRLNFQYSLPTLSPGHAKRLMESTVGRLEDAVRN